MWVLLWRQHIWTTGALSDGLRALRKSGRASHELISLIGMTQIPMYNVNNNCSTGSTALYLGRQIIEYGISDCVLCVGFEKMQRGFRGLKGETD